MRQEIIVNADDFGLDTQTNRAILSAFGLGLLSSTSVLANMQGFEEACDLAQGHDLRNRIGLHFNLFEGRPLSRAMTESRRFCREDGSFRGRGRAIRLSPSDAQAVEEELEAQLDACVLQGIRPIHLDSHHHYHTEWPIGTVAIRLAQRHSIPRIRLSRNLGRGIGIVKRAYKTLYNTRLARRGLAGCRHFGSVEAVRPVLASLRGGVEIGVHPRLNSEEQICDYEDGPELAGLLNGLGIAPQDHGA